MVTDVPAGPDVGLKLVILGVVWNTVIVAVADFVRSVIEVAVSVTAEGLGAIAGAL